MSDDIPPPPPPEEPTPQEASKRVLKEITVNGQSVKDKLNHVRAPSDGVHPAIATVSAISHQRVPSLKSVDKPASGLSNTIKNEYLKDQSTEQRSMRRNSKLVNELHASLPPPPFPDDHDVPPPPPAEHDSKKPAFLGDINPQSKIRLAPVVAPHDGPNPHLLAMEAIKSDRRSSLNSVPPPPPTELHPDMADAWLEETHQENESLRRNTVMLDTLRTDKKAEDEWAPIPGRDRKATVHRLKALANED